MKRTLQIILMIGVLSPVHAAGEKVSGLKSVAQQHARYARALAAEDLRINSDRLAWLGKRAEVDECSLSAQDNSDLNDWQKHQLSIYVDLYCKPWKNWWTKVLDQCESKQRPKWCDEGAGKLSLADYFSTLLDALKGATGDTERYSLIFVMVDTLNAHVLSEFPEDDLEPWFRDAAKEFLTRASVDDVLTIGERFQGTWLGLFPSVAQQLEAYGKAHADLSSDQEKRLQAILKQRFSDDK
jgi:hypothetical protein